MCARTRSAPVRTSVVVPAYNEATLLPRLLASIDEARACYRHGSQAVEVIVADNGSTDATAEIARQSGCAIVHVASGCFGCAGSRRRFRCASSTSTATGTSSPTSCTCCR